jgi:O-antigen/teichoic acid export membrane protein
MIYRRAMLVGSADFFSKGVAALSTLVIIRLLPVEEFAEFTYATSLVMLLHHLAAVSFNRAFVIGYKDLGLEVKTQGYFFAQFALVLSLGAAILPWCGLKPWLAAAVMASAVLYAAMEAIKTVFQQRLHFRQYSVFEVTRNVLGLILLIMMIPLSHETFQSEWVLAVQGAAIALPILPLARKLQWRRIGSLLRYGVATLIKILRGPMAVLVGYVIGTSILAQLDVILLKVFGTTADLATYGVALRFYGFLMVGLQSMHFVALPTLTKATTREEMKKMFSGQAKMWLFSGAALAVLFWSSRFFIPLAGGDRYPGAVPVFRVLCISALFSFWFAPHVNVVLRFQEFKGLTLTVAASLALHVFACWYAIPRHGAMGAAAATLVTFLFLNLTTFCRAQKLLNDPEKAGHNLNSE